MLPERPDATGFMLASRQPQTTNVTKLEAMEISKTDSVAEADNRNIQCVSFVKAALRIRSCTSQKNVISV